MERERERESERENLVNKYISEEQCAIKVIRYLNFI